VSEPIKKIKKTPESYSPKGRPEILNMMEQSKKSKQHEHLTENARLRIVVYGCEHPAVSSSVKMCGMNLQRGSTVLTSVTYA